jgi:hypothetical protein
MDEAFLLSKAKPATWHLIVAKLIICFLIVKARVETWFGHEFSDY